MNGRKPNKEEQKWIDAILEIGCIVCSNEFGIYSPAAIHHINGSKKNGWHFDTIPLCWQHHQSGKWDEQCISRHPHKSRFEARYGTELELLILCRGLVSES